jgi:hypothetical protein
MGAHALRSASGAKRWMNCPGSLRMEEGRPSNSSDAARLGTAAHALGEACLTTNTDALDWVGGKVTLDSRENATAWRPRPVLRYEVWQRPVPGQAALYKERLLATFEPWQREEADEFRYLEDCDEPAPDKGDFRKITLEPVYERDSGDLTVALRATYDEDGDEPLEEGEEVFPIDDDMAGAVQVYVEAVRGELERLGGMAELSVERRFNLSWLVGFDFDEEAYQAAKLRGEIYVSPSGIARQDDGMYYYMADGRRCWGPMFGTNDASIFLVFDHITVVDYKHGQGVVVEVEENEQELYYALGIAREVEWAFDTLDLLIVQPRARHEDGAVRRWSTTKAELRAFEERLRVAAIATEDPDAPLKAGEWCRFCRAAPICRELREEAFRIAQLDFGDGFQEPTTMATDAETSEADLELRMRSLPLLNAFTKAVETEALRRLRETPGGEASFGKLVRKRSKRKFREDLTQVDPQTGEDVPVHPFDYLQERGIPRAMLFEEPKPKSPAKVEKVRPPELMARLKAEKVKAPAAFIKALVAEVSYKPEGGVTVAPPNDPRPAVDPSAAAAADFETYEESDDE